LKKRPILKKLSWFRTDSYVALKIVKSSSQYTESALEEIKLLECVKKTNASSPGYQHVAQLLDHFEVLGESLLSLMKRYNYKGIPQHIVKRIAQQVLEGLDYLHRECGIVHTDLKPENVLVWIPDIEDYLKKDNQDILKLIEEKGEAAPTTSWLDGVDTTGMSKARKKKLKKKIKKKAMTESVQENGVE
jgi:serine/threonine-protein kinase SRPK3